MQDRIKEGSGLITISKAFGGAVRPWLSPVPSLECGEGEAVLTCQHVPGGPSSRCLLEV